MEMKQDQGSTGRPQGPRTTYDMKIEVRIRRDGVEDLDQVPFIIGSAKLEEEKLGP